jgi:two-component system response regulator YesN
MLTMLACYSKPLGGWTLRIMIADDESLVRMSLISMIKEMEYPWEIVGEASDGDDLLRLLAQVSPDVVLVDIRMPIVNGIEAIRQGKEICPLTRWIILSGAAEFQYAQEALKLGATDYLLKPASPEELESALCKVASERQNYRIMLNRQFESDIISLYGGLSSLQQEHEDSFLHRAYFAGVVFYTDSHLDEKSKAAVLSSYYKYARELIEGVLIYPVQFAIFVLPSGETAIVGAWERSEEEEGKPVIMQVFDSLAKRAMIAENQQFAITLLQSGICHSFDDLQDQILTMHRLAFLRIGKGVGCRWELHQLLECEKFTDIREISSHFMHLMQAYKEKNYVRYMNLIENMKMANFISLLQYYQRKSSLQAFVLSATGCALGNEITDWADELQRLGEWMLTERNQLETGVDLIQQVVSQIKENYRLDIGIGQIAGELNVTPSYLSTLFHKKTGFTFMKYLTRIRMNKAKELLADSQLQVQQVAEQVGYYSTRHFTKLFTESVGCNPSEYKKRLSAIMKTNER